VAVLGGTRQAALPDVPTFSELGLKGFEDVPYYGVFAPAGTAKATLDEFSTALQRVIALPEVRERLTGLGLTVGHMPGEQLAARERAYSQTWAKIIRDSGFQPQ
jgi:tripartite-type tricarboxylate transporter receptor subunit TctC